MYSMRESMPYFVSTLRSVDEWKRKNARRADAIIQAEYDANKRDIKSPFARSSQLEELVRFLDDTALDINFMVQLPSIEKCLDPWWELYASSRNCIDQDQLRTVYYDLAFILVEAKTENTHQNSVSMVLRASWTKWSPKEPPLTKAELFRLLFILGHLASTLLYTLPCPISENEHVVYCLRLMKMTTTDRLGDYVVFFQELMSKLTRCHLSRRRRTQVRMRSTKVHRKSSLTDILSKGGPPVVYISPSRVDQPMQYSPVVNVKLERISTQQHLTSLEDQTADRYVEIVERNAQSQHIVVDPLLHERKFQEKWKRANNEKTVSLNGVMVNQNPTTNRYFPPLFISRVRTSSPPAPLLELGHSRSTPAIVLKSNRSENILSMVKSHGLHTEESPRDMEIMRRSLSQVTLKERIKHKHEMCVEQEKKSTQKNTINTKQRDSSKPSSQIYLAIST